MSQKKINVLLKSEDPLTDVLIFNIEDEPIAVNLNSQDCQASMKKVFAALLKLLIYDDIELGLTVGEEFNRQMYIEVCREYIKDLNRELNEVKVTLRDELCRKKTFRLP